jgi:hypothetical protein
VTFKCRVFTFPDKIFTALPVNCVVRTGSVPADGGVLCMSQKHGKWEVKWTANAEFLLKEFH